MQKLLLALCALTLIQAVSFGQCDCCPQCGSKVAVGFLEKTKEKVTTYDVELKEIAVPDICMPKPLFNLKAQLCGLFGKKCVPGSPCGACEIKDCPKHIRNGQVRTIKVLKKKSAECAACKYKWEVTDMEKVNEYLYGPVDKPEAEKSEAPAEPAEAEVKVEEAVELMPVEAAPAEQPGLIEEPPVELTPPPAPAAGDSGSTSTSFLIRKPYVVK